MFLILLIVSTLSQASYLDEAIELHQRGDPESIVRALDMYRTISVKQTSSSQQEKQTLSDAALALHNMALIYHTENPTSEAPLRLLDEAIELDPTMAHLFNTRGGLYNGILGNFHIAIESYRKALELNPDEMHYHLSLAAVSHYGAADHAAKNGDFGGQDDSLTEACRHYAIALEIGENTMSTSMKVEVLNDYSIALSKLGRQMEVSEVLRRAVDLDGHNLQSLGNYAIALREIGDMEGALRIGEAALEIVPHEVRMRFNYGLILQTLERLSEAAQQWELCLEYDRNFYPALESLGHYQGTRGDPLAARTYYKLALEAASRIINSGSVSGSGDGVMSAADAQSSIGKLRLMSATACIPPIFKNNQDITTARTDFTQSLHKLLQDHYSSGSSELIIHDPMTSLGSGSLGYYLIYTGHNDVFIRRLLASVYWQLAPSLRYTAPFLSSFTPQMDEEGALKKHTNDGDVTRLIRVGFVSSFFYRHSVGLLMQGVIRGLSQKPDQFFVELVYPVPHADPSDKVFLGMSQAVHKRVEIPKSNLIVARSIIAAEKLDVLIYAEIGMDHLNYFLSFSRLARRTAVFWGHAVTSGITPMDAVVNADSFTHAGGCDYFISSDIFEASPTPQRRYSERLYLMRGLTTSFFTPEQVDVQRDINVSALGFPLLSPLDSEGDGVHLYLIPQTLYKLNPNFDLLIAGVLMKDDLAFVGMPTAQESRWTDLAMQRLQSSLGEELFKRVHIFRRLSFTEFSALAASAHVILDPFPLGGGRSSLEIFSAGTPIVVLAARTHILQLTSGMYETMGISSSHDRHFENELLVTHSFKDYIKGAVSIATNVSLRTGLRKLIAENKHQLYHRQDVIEEWAEFLTFASRAPRPVGDWWNVNHPLRAVDLFGSNIQSKPSEQSLKRAVEVASASQVDSPPLKEKLMIRVEDAIGGAAVGEGVEEDVDFEVEKSERTKPEPTRHLDAISIRMSKYDSLSPGYIKIDGGRTRLMKGDEGQGGWYWSKRPWGWEAVAGESMSDVWPNEKAEDLLYALKLGHTDESSQESFTFLVEVFRGEDPSRVASLLAERIEAEPVKAQWLRCLLSTGVQQHAKNGQFPAAVLPLQLVDAFTGELLMPITIDPLESTQHQAQWGREINIHIGDDLKLVAGYMSYRYAFGDGGEETIFNFLSSAIPEYSSPEWVETRQQTCLVSETSHTQVYGDIGRTHRSLEDTLSSDDLESCSVVIGMTTCKRLDLFTMTANSMLNMLGDTYAPSGKGLVCRIIVVDDGSPMQDIVQMKASFPYFEYVLKPSHKRGHAHSMNMLLDMVSHAPFFLYVEDDWLFLDRIPSILLDAYQLLRESRKGKESSEKIAQVLFNSQGSRLCAYADPNCAPEDLYGSGWLRTIQVPHHRGDHRQVKVIEYMKHEFGTAEGHPFSYWPGFSLNPGLWDLRALSGLRFNTSDSRFEQSISLRVAMSGLRTAHFPRLSVKHIGVETSAYELNGLRRPWDRSLDGDRAG